MAPAGPRVFVQLVPRKLFHFDVQGKRKLSLLQIVIFNRSFCMSQPHARQIASTAQLICCLFAARKTTTFLREDIPGRCMGVCRTAPLERDKYSR